MPRKKKDGPDLFTFLNQIFYKSKGHKYDKKLAPAYLISMWLSHDPALINIVHKMNSLQFYLPDDIIYEYYVNEVPKGKRFIKWTKKSPEDKKRKKKIEEIKEDYQVSKKEAMIILSHIERIKNGKTKA